MGVVEWLRRKRADQRAEFEQAEANRAGLADQATDLRERIEQTRQQLDQLVAKQRAESPEQQADGPAARAAFAPGGGTGQPVADLDGYEEVGEVYEASGYPDDGEPTWSVPALTPKPSADPRSTGQNPPPPPPPAAA